MKGRWSRKLMGVFLGLFIVFALLYVGDALIWQVRLARGSAYGTIEVHQFLATSLKGNKIEYDMTGTVQEQCARALFPQRGNPACWWLERHKAQWE